MSDVIDVRVAANGRMVLPRAVLEALGVTGAGVVVLLVNGGEVRMTSMRESVRRTRALYRQRVIDDQPTETFIEARRAEAALERARDEGSV